MKAVVLEDYAIQQGDLDWSGVKALVPDITRYCLLYTSPSPRDCS